jgi:hypothetical protein
MASDESMAMISSSMQDDDGDDTDEYGNYVSYDHHSHTHNMSRLSMMCTSSMDDNIDDDVINNMFMSKLSLESFDGHDADEEFSDDDSDEEPACYSLPATPPRHRVAGGGLLKDQLIRVKDYASENELQNGGGGVVGRRRKNRRKRKVIKQRSVRNQENYNMGFDRYSEESESGLVAGGGDGGVMVITRPKGGGRSLCMDLEEVRACKDLGFELEHERMFSGGSRASTLDTGATSSGGNSPIASWRISSPGDDPRDVKARLKVWAQAVALASTPQQGN